MTPDIQAGSDNAGNLTTASSQVDLDQLSIQLTAAYSAGDQGAIVQILAQIENLAGAASGGAATPTSGMLQYRSLAGNGATGGGGGEIPQPQGSNFYVTPGGTALRAPEGYVGIEARNKAGLVLLPEGQSLENNSNIIRYGDPTSTAGPYFRYYNNYGQPLNPTTGRPGPNSVTHILEGYQGPLLGYPGN